MRTYGFGNRTVDANFEILKSSDPQIRKFLTRLWRLLYSGRVTPCFDSVSGSLPRTDIAR